MTQITDEQRAEEIISVFKTAFGTLLQADPSAFNVKFRKMAASAFAFYRGSACLFYNDQTKHAEHDPFLNDQTKAIWMHGDLHAENFGTYMDSEGRLVFNVNDFDEAYPGPFTWDLKRLAASIALIGYSKALSDEQIVMLVREYAAAYRERIHLLATGQSQQGFTLTTAEGPILEALHSARNRSRIDMLNSQTEIHNYERRFKLGKGTIALDNETKAKIEQSFKKYLETLQRKQPTSVNTFSTRIKDIVGRRGVGIGSAGLPSFNLLLEGGSEALENDIIVYMKQSIPAAVSHFAPHDVAQQHFQHEGHRTVLSQRALQAHSGNWLGWAEIDGKGQLVSEVSPYEVDLEWDEINKPAEMAKVLADLGRATAMMHGAGDDDEKHSGLVPFSPEKVIDTAITANEDKFEQMLVDFALKYGDRARRDHSIFVDLFRNGRIPGLANV